MTTTLAPLEPNPIVFHCGYIHNALFELPELIERAATELADVDVDTLVGTGFSGSVVIPMLAAALNKRFVLVRKDNDDSHHGGGRLVGSLGQRWLFVDDFVSSGTTRDRVVRKINQAIRDDYEFRCGTPNIKHVGQYLYGNGDSRRLQGPESEPWCEITGTHTLQERSWLDAAPDQICTACYEVFPAPTNGATP